MCSAPIHAPELDWLKHLFVIRLTGQMTQCIVNSYHSGHCACGKLLRGHRFKPQRSKRLSQQSLQRKPSATRQGALRLCGISPTICSERKHSCRSITQLKRKIPIIGRTSTAPANSRYTLVWPIDAVHSNCSTQSCGCTRSTTASEVIVILR